MAEIIFILLPIFFIIAIIYSSAGFGGGSSYLAVLTLFQLEFTTIKIIALLCNIVVVSGSVYIFYKNGFFNFRKTLPLILLSIPLAYLGGSLKIAQDTFFIILGFTLLLASAVMLFTQQHQVLKLPKYSNAAIGGGIGFLSGMVGIGGGIFLSPLLYLSRWAEAKVIAATTASFILVNSIAGLVGQISTHGFRVDIKILSLLLITVFIGGQIGSRLTAYRIKPQLLRKITAVLILVVAIRILSKYLFPLFE